LSRKLQEKLWNFLHKRGHASGVISIKQCKNSTKINWKLRNKAKQAQAQSIMQKWVGLWVSPGSMGYDLDSIEKVLADGLETYPHIHVLLL
jgi:hypothetical protein